MIIEQIPVGNMDNFAYLVGDSETKEACIFDPAWDVSAFLDAAKKHGLTISKIVITHIDFDHINAVGDLFESTKAKVYVHPLGRKDIEAYGVTDIEEISEGSTIAVGTVSFKVMHTPGHRPTSCCFIFGDNIITGDTLFVEGCGRVDLPGGDSRKQWESLERLKGLDENLKVYPGHNYGSIPVSSIKHEKENNPFLQCNSFEDFLNIR